MKVLDTFSQKINHSRIVKPLMIAEAGVNHEGSMELAHKLIKEAAEGGADAIKFQTYKAHTIASKDSPSYWDRTKEPTDSQYKLFKKYDNFDKKEFEQLKIWCDQEKIDFMSTPFDVDSAIFLNDLMDVYKISSSDITNKPFIKFLAGFGKPIILSTGASTTQEIDNAVDWIKEMDVDFALLHCILNYPTEDKNANLGMIKALQERYPEKLIGYSDHTLPYDLKTLELATMMGCSIIEKHFTHDKSLPGNDHYHAMDKNDLIQFNQIVDRVLNIIGDYNKRPLESEGPAIKNARRSLVAQNNINKNSKIKASDLTWKRPAHGISPSKIDELIGMTVNEDISEDTVLQWEMFSK